MAPPNRVQVLAYARVYGDKAAAVRFAVPRNTIRTWRRRMRKAAERQTAGSEQGVSPVAPVSAAGSGPDSVEDGGNGLAEVAGHEAGMGGVVRDARPSPPLPCLHCDGSGLLRLPADDRGPARTIECPDGCQVRRLQVVEHPPEQGGEWEHGMARFGDLIAAVSDHDYRRDWTADRQPPPGPLRPRGYLKPVPEWSRWP
jgi:hypothetical protein